MGIRLMRAAAFMSLAASIAVMPANATVVASSLPFQDTPVWTDVVFGGTSMSSNGTSSTLTTAQGRGIWFGWQSGQNTPSWSPASNADGNYLDLTMSLSVGARDWSAYFHDGVRQASLQFNPTNCNGNIGNCTLAPYLDGVTLSFVTAGNLVADVFVPLDTTASNRFEFLLRGNQVAYRINGALYTGLAGQGGGTILVIGDGSGSTLTGWGSMNVTGVAFDAAPAFSELEDLSPAVPEPATWAMLVAGFGLTGAGLRRQRRGLAMRRQRRGLTMRR